MSPVVEAIALWLGVGAFAAIAYSGMWWARERAKKREARVRRRQRLASAARESVRDRKPYRALGGYMGGDSR